MKIKAVNPKTVEIITDAYLECAAWCDNIQDAKFTKKARKQAYKDCEDFVRLILKHNLEDSIPAWYDDTYIGYDFWLTRNRHGTGFWDKGLGTLGSELTKLAHTYGECNTLLTPNKLWINLYP